MTPFAEVIRAVGEGLVWPTGPALVWLIVFRTFPGLRHATGLLALSALTVGLLYRERLPAWLLVHGLITVLLLGLVRLPTAGGVRWKRARWLMAGLTLAFVAGRARAFDGWHGLVFATTFPGTVLDMLVFLKLFTAFWEVGSGKIKVLQPEPLLAWLMMPWGGVLLRLSEFIPQWPTLLSVAPRPLRAGPFRFRILDWAGHLVAWLLLLVTDALLRSEPGPLKTTGILWGGFVAGPVGFYLAAHLLARTNQMLAGACGLQLPDNYNRPLGRPNLSEFWANWNITYTNVFRDLCFYNRWGRKQANPYLNSIILFTLVGFWHSADPYWVLWGLMHGVGFAVFLLWKHRWQAAIRVRWPIRLPYARPLARLGTYGFVCLCWLAPAQILKAMRFLAVQLVGAF